MAERSFPLRIALRGVVLVVTLVALAWAAHWLTEAGVASERWIDAEVAGRGWPGHLAFLAMGALTTALGFPRQVIAFLAGYAFGALVGTEMALLATLLGCVATFGYSRMLARAFVARHFGERIRQLDDFLDRAPLQMTLIVRLLPIGSNLLTNLLAGVTRVRFGPFVTGSAIGYLPQTLAFAVAGSGMQVAPFQRSALAIALLVASTLFGLQLYRRRRRGCTLEGEIDRSLDDLPARSRPGSA
jgi:uncharacterized membrane protein YdjX (TVP38/TMEM64 family)